MAMDLIAFANRLGIRIGIFALFALGLNLHYGYTGLVNFGHVAFFLVGAYTSILVTVNPDGLLVPVLFALDLPIPVGLAAATIVTGVVGAVVAIPAIRLRSHYLAVLTLGLAETVRAVVRTEDWLVGGTAGIQNVPRPFTDFLTVTIAEGILGVNLWLALYLGIVVAAILLAYTFIERLGNSPFGRILNAIREDEEAAQAFGKNTNKFKVYSFGFGAAIAGLSGALFVHFLGGVSPGAFRSQITFIAWTIMILGGSGNNKGVLLGAVILLTYQQMMSFVPWSVVFAGRPYIGSSLELLSLGVLLIVLLRWRPEGIWKEVREVY